MSVSDTRNLDRLNSILYDRPAGRNIIEHAIDIIAAKDARIAELEWECESLSALLRSCDAKLADLEEESPDTPVSESG